MITARPVALLAVVFAALLAAGCGGSIANRGPAHASGAAPPAVVASANATCRYFRRELKQLGQGGLKGSSPTILALTTERVVKPSIPLLERVAKRQQALEPAARDPRFDLYANLFDPAIVLAQQRLRAGQAGEISQSSELETLLTNLGLEQMQAARQAGLRDCNLDFQHVLLTSLSG